MAAGSAGCLHTHIQASSRFSLRTCLPDRPVLDLDRPDARTAAASDPGFIVSGPGPVLIDEFQHVPEILDAIKAELNTDTRPGRYVLTGSTRYSVLPQAAQSLTGRAHVINVLPLSQGELHGHRDNFIDRLWADPARLPQIPSRPVTRDAYVDRILAGGFPMILHRLTTRARTSWFADYVNLVVMRDVLDIARVRQREALPRLLRQLAAQTGQMLNISKAGQAVGLESSTANRYATLLEAAFMIQRLPAWGTALGKRITAYPKVHVIDSGLAGWLLGLSAAKIASRDPAVLTEFGHLVETFAVGEILKQVSWSEEAATAAYFRTQDGDEVDLVLETWDGRVAGFEVKAGSRVQDADLSGLRLLRDRLGERFIAGFLLNLGELAYRKEERIMVMPLSGLWSLALQAELGSKIGVKCVVITCVDEGNRCHRRRRGLMPVRLSGKDIVKALGKGSWELERVTGSHRGMRHSDGRHVSVPVHGAGRSRSGRSHRSAARSAAPRTNCATFFRVTGRPV